MVVNFWLLAFNLIPAFPMDGGRVLRALLATRMEYSRATLVAARVGQAIAFLFGFVGLFTDPFLVFIALFVWMGAEQESATVQMHNSLGGIPVQQAMLTNFRTSSLTTLWPRRSSTCWTAGSRISPWFLAITCWEC